MQIEAALERHCAHPNVSGNRFMLHHLPDAPPTAPSTLANP